MGMKGSGEATDWKEIDRFDHGVGWIAYPEETMQRASHAVEVDGDVWVVDPVDIDGLDDLLAEFGDVAGVVTLLDRHKRDSATVANRHDVSVWVPKFMDGVVEDINAPTEQFRHDLGDSGFAAHTVVDNRFWQEAVLYSEDLGVLVIPETLGSADYFRVGDRPLGVHPMLRALPPKNVTRLEPERIRVGHGSGVDENATEVMHDAFSGARARTPQLYFKNFKKLIFG